MNNAALREEIAKLQARLAEVEKERDAAQLDKLACEGQRRSLASENQAILVEAKHLRDFSIWGTDEITCKADHNNGQLVGYLVLFRGEPEPVFIPCEAGKRPGATLASWFTTLRAEAVRFQSKAKECEELKQAMKEKEAQTLRILNCVNELNLDKLGQAIKYLRVLGFDIVLKS